MTHRKDLALLREALLSLPRSESATPQCLDDETVAALAEARLEPGDRSVALAHLAACQRCRGAVAALARALADRQVAREVLRVERPRRRSLWVLGPLAAAALVLLILSPRGPNDGPGHRAPVGTMAAPEPIAPVGAVSGARELGWKAVAGADRYRVTLFASGGTVLFETQLADTVVSIPDSVVLATGRRYLWKVEARTGFDRWIASSLVEFVVAGEPQR